MLSQFQFPFKRVENTELNQASFTKDIADFKSLKDKSDFFQIKFKKKDGTLVKHQYWGIDRAFIGTQEGVEQKRKLWLAYLNFLERLAYDLLNIHYSFFSVVKEDLKKAREFESLSEANINDLEKVALFYETIIFEESSSKIKEKIDFISYIKEAFNLGLIQSAEASFYSISKVLNSDKESFLLCSRHPISGKSNIYFDSNGDDRLDPSIWKWLKTIEVKQKKAIRLTYFYEGKDIFFEELDEIHLSAEGELKLVKDFVEEGILDKQEAFNYISIDFFNGILLSKLDPRLKSTPIIRGLAASPGGCSGRICFSNESLNELVDKGDKGILFLDDSFFKDMGVIKKASGVICPKGGLTSHLAILCRSLGIPCIMSLSLQSSAQERSITIGTRKINEESYLSIDGDSGEVFLGEIPLIPAPLKKEVKEVLNWSDSYRDKALMLNADAPIELMGTDKIAYDGIGLCRTENLLFLPGRLSLLQRALYEDNLDKRKANLRELFPYFRNDFQGFFQVLDGKSINIRLFDTDFKNLILKESQIENFAKDYNYELKDLRRKSDAFTEKNTSLGLRGGRLAIAYPEIYEMLIRSIFEAAVNMKLYGIKLELGILIPLVSHEKEFETIRQMIVNISSKTFEEMGEVVDYKLGVMIETPKACLEAEKLAPFVDYMTFGTNDLTQMTLGISRDDSSRILKTYQDKSILKENPFTRIDQGGVGELMKVAIEKSRSKNEEIEFLACGEHVYNKDSLEFFYSIGIDGFSTSIYSTPYVKVALAQMALQGKIH